MTRIFPLPASALSWALYAILMITMSESTVQAFNYDESKVPDFTLPEALISESGQTITTPDQWNEIRRPELIQLFENHVYGRQPGSVPDAVYQQILFVPDALDGKATLREIRITFPSVSETFAMYLLLWTPNHGNSPFPGFVGLNFAGNHSTHLDTRIRLSSAWMRESNDGTVENHRATEASRGKAASRWPVELIISRGYALGTIYCGDIDPDFHDGFHNGVHGMFPEFMHADGSGKRPENAWGTIAGWSWGLSRALDYFTADPSMNHKKIAVIGHSRLGKTALWAGATDPRFALVVSNNSGCGGAALSRRAFGETVARINTAFPHWFCDGFKKFNDNENAIPVDQHQLMALIAPRPLYVASAEEDLWADPQGEFISLKLAAPVYQLLGKTPIFPAERPAINQPEMQDTGYHIRSGKHDINEYDWTQYLNFADKHLK